MAEFASNGKGNLAVTLGGVALGTSLLSGMSGINGILGGNVEDRHITRHEMDLIREIQAKDQAIAISTSENYVDKKLVDVYTELAKQDKATNARIDTLRNEQNAINTQQAVYNGTNAATLNCMQNSINTLLAMTKTVIPADNVCPKPMPQYNSWTAPTNPS